MLEKDEKYLINNIIEKVSNHKDTNFINEKLFKYIDPILKKKHIECSIYEPYPMCSKRIIYYDKPNVCLFKIITKDILTHPKILGSIMALNIEDDMFGDIVIDNNNYYILIKECLKYTFISSLTYIGNTPIKLEEVNINTLNSFSPSFETINVIVSSLRADTLISRIIGTGRDSINAMIKNKYILINYQELTNNSYTFKKGDIFSVRRYGKYIFDGIIKETKKDNFVIECRKYK